MYAYIHINCINYCLQAINTRKATVRRDSHLIPTTLPFHSSLNQRGTLFSLTVYWHVYKNCHCMPVSWALYFIILYATPRSYNPAFPTICFLCLSLRPFFLLSLFFVRTRVSVRRLSTNIFFSYWLLYDSILIYTTGDILNMKIFPPTLARMCK